MRWLIAGIPFLFATGGGRSIRCPSASRRRPTLTKPYHAGRRDRRGRRFRSPDGTSNLLRMVPALVLMEHNSYDASSVEQTRYAAATTRDDRSASMAAQLKVIDADKAQHHGQAEGAGSRAGADRSRVRQGLGDEAGQPRDDGDRDRSRPARSGSTSRSASAACRAAASSRSTARKARARPRLRCTPSPRRRRRAAPPPSSMPNMRSIRAMPRSWASTSTS